MIKKYLKRICKPCNELYKFLNYCVHEQLYKPVIVLTKYTYLISSCLSQAHMSDSCTGSTLIMALINNFKYTNILNFGYTHAVLL